MKEVRSVILCSRILKTDGLIWIKSGMSTLSGCVMIDTYLNFELLYFVAGSISMNFGIISWGWCEKVIT